MEKSNYYFGNSGKTSTNNYNIASCAKNMCFTVTVAYLCYTALSIILSFEVKGVCFFNQNCTVDQDHKSSHLYTGESDQLTIERTNVLIFSLPRSGSSFLGEIFNREDDSLYLYEPLHAHDALEKLPIIHHTGGVERSRGVQNKNILLTIQNLYSCKMKEENDLFQFLSYPELSNPHFRLMSKVLSSPPFCDYSLAQNSTELEYRRHCFYINTTLLSLICGDKKSIVVKDLLHRLPLYQPQMLKKMFELKNLKSIWLVRDPRAIISSMMSLTWMESGNEIYRNAFNEALRMSIKKVCNLYHQFLETLSTVFEDSLRRSRLIIIRYEDLMTKPLSTVYQILKFAKINVRIDTLNWVLENINGRVTTGNKRGESFSILHRNSSYSLTSWRKTLDFQHVLSIQNQCTQVMRRFGYVEFSDKSTMYDLNISSIVEMYDELSFDSNIEQLLKE